MGNINEPMILGALAGIETVLRRHGVPLGQGAMDAAIASLNSPVADTLSQAAE
jgi:hypothetical protein